MKKYNGAIAILYKRNDGKINFLLNENKKNGNFTLISGAKEEFDKSLEDTAIREIKEELNLNPTDYILIPTAVKHEFIFGPNKPEREGQKGSYSVFLADVTDYSGKITHKEENRQVVWMIKSEATKKISFDDLREVFKKACEKIE